MDNKDNKNITIFQKLGQVLTRNSVIPPPTNQKFNVGKKELLKTTSKEEFNTKKLEALQGKHLKNMWNRVEGETYQQTMHYEMTRIGSYSDFENMEFFPEIAAALDIFMEESTTPNPKGEILNIHSNSSRIKGVLEELFYNNLKVHTNLPMWVRNVCKYGDNFLFLNIDENEGVIAGKQLPNYEIERKEMDFIDSLRITDKANVTKFNWRGKDIVFQSWQIAHFRILGDDRKLPYGTSLLEKCRRIWKQLLMAEDAMLVYRVTRAPERRVYKIYVGNIDDEDVEAYVNNIANKFKRTQLIDPQTGQIDVRYNQMSNTEDYFIPVRDENAPNPIDTLPGASNLDQIGDLEYLQKKLCTGLRVPKSFLGFDEATGDGKNLALMDIRFSRTINRVQQSMIQELNRIAIIHLHMLGFTDDLDNFTLSLNNPSSQAKMLEIEQTQSKVTLFKDIVSDAGDGFKTMSRTRASKEIFNWSDEDIRQDLLEQRMEKAASAEMENTSKVIKHTGMFDKVDKLYGDMEAAKKGGGDDAEGGDEDGGSGGGGGFGGGFSGDNLDFEEGAEEGDPDMEADDIDAETEGMDDVDFSALDDEGGDDADSSEAEKTEESLLFNNPLILENYSKRLETKEFIAEQALKQRNKKYKDIYMSKLIDSLNPSKKNIVTENLDLKSNKNGKTIEMLINEIDSKLKM